MMDQAQSNRIFKLNMTFKDPLQNKLFSLFKGQFGQVLDLLEYQRSFAPLLERHATCA
jgi:hypothetical protein